jgi:hypothetical protein
MTVAPSGGAAAKQVNRFSNLSCCKLANLLAAAFSAIISGFN